MLRRINLLLVAFATILAGLMGISTPTAHAADRDCGDFATQRSAQIFFLNNGGPNSDPHGLDGDGNGVACESNPCPCYIGITPPGDGGDGGTPPPAEDETEPIKKNKAKVIKVVDGDTVDVKILPRGPKVRVRVLGIDTPEVYGGEECGGPEASKALEKLLPRGARVRLQSDRTQDLRDRYGRLLRYISKPNGTDVGRSQVRHGRAEVYVYDKPFARVKDYRRAQSIAKKNDLGIWGNC